MKTIIVPILPGKTEAWRRLLQELCASRRPQLSAWCDEVGVSDLKIWLSEASGVSLAVVSFRDPSSSQTGCHDNTPFMRWMSRQLLAIHGVDLPRLLAGQSRSLLLEL